jgi:hypothetical protein
MTTVEYWSIQNNFNGFPVYIILECGVQQKWTCLKQIMYNLIVIFGEFHNIYRTET